MAAFLSEYCGLASSAKCDCGKRIGYAVRNGRLDPAKLDYSGLETDEAEKYTRAMEAMDAQSLIFAKLPRYGSPQAIKDFLSKVLQGDDMATILREEA